MVSDLLSKSGQFIHTVTLSTQPISLIVIFRGGVCGIMMITVFWNITPYIPVVRVS
jgi:hypothetical protein